MNRTVDAFTEMLEDFSSSVIAEFFEELEKIKLSDTDKLSEFIEKLGDKLSKCPILVDKFGRPLEVGMPVSFVYGGRIHVDEIKELKKFFPHVVLKNERAYRDYRYIQDNILAIDKNEYVGYLLKK